MSVKIIFGMVVAAIMAYGVWAMFSDKIRAFLAGIFTGKAAKEKYIRELMDGVSDEDKSVSIEKMCRALTAKDLAGRDLNYQIIFDLGVHRSLDFAVEAVNQASNSESLRRSIREDYIRRLMNKELRYGDVDVFGKVCTPLTLEDFAGRKLSKENVYSMDRRLDTGLVVDIVMQAPNSESLLQSILDDLTEDGYDKDEKDFRRAESILKAAYRKGILTQEIEAKQWTIVDRHDDYGNDCGWHNDKSVFAEFKL